MSGAGFRHAEEPPMTNYARDAESAAILALAPVVPVLTVQSVEDALGQARALVAGGLLAIEVTLRTPPALAAIAAIADQVPGAVVGAGTIVSPQQIDDAVAAGARFLVSPGATPALAQAAVAAPVPFLPGCATVSEAMALRELGFRALKLFPAEAVGGARLLASIAAPLPDLRFCPTGGIDLARAPDYLKLPNVACVGGSWMLPKEALASGDYARVETLAREAAGLERG
jgi:2-dehydro-3-deoxyphosphogluconate aldolase/(4S)-4-hydroxy-2-oxoglutarate aldolase